MVKIEELDLEFSAQGREEIGHTTPSEKCGGSDRVFIKTV